MIGSTDAGGLRGRGRLQRQQLSARTTPGHVFQVDVPSAAAHASTGSIRPGTCPDIPVDSVINNPELSRSRSSPAPIGVVYLHERHRLRHPLTWYRFEAGLPHVDGLGSADIDPRRDHACRRGPAAAERMCIPLPSSAISPAPVLVSAVSRLDSRIAAGTFDLSLLAQLARPVLNRAAMAPGNFTIVHHP